MTHAFTTRIRKHFEHVIALITRQIIAHLKGTSGLPLRLPFRFNHFGTIGNSCAHGLLQVGARTRRPCCRTVKMSQKAQGRRAPTTKATAAPLSHHQAIADKKPHALVVPNALVLPPARDVSHESASESEHRANMQGAQNGAIAALDEWSATLQLWCEAMVYERYSDSHHEHVWGTRLLSCPRSTALTMPPMSRFGTIFLLLLALHGLLPTLSAQSSNPRIDAISADEDDEELYRQIQEDAAEFRVQLRRNRRVTTSYQRDAKRELARIKDLFTNGHIRKSFLVAEDAAYRFAYSDVGAELWHAYFRGAALPAALSARTKS